MAKRVVELLLMLCFGMSIAAVLALASAPECLGDRHYDEIGECCPTTTTTLPTETVCPDPAPCPTVVCECGEGTTVNYVTVNRCPEVVFPKYAPCKLRRPDKERSGDVLFDGYYYKCPKKLTPRRYFVPLG